MKIKAISGIIIGLLIMLALPLPAVAAAPTPVVTVSQLIYRSAGGYDQVIADTSWQNAHPDKIQIVLGALDGSGAYADCDAPKGLGSKYQQHYACGIELYPGQWPSGMTITVKVLLIDKKGDLIATTQILATITWGTYNTWTL